MCEREKTERLRGCKGLHIEKRIEFIEEGKEWTERGKESRGASHYYNWPPLILNRTGLLASVCVCVCVCVRPCCRGLSACLLVVCIELELHRPSQVADCTRINLIFDRRAEDGGWGKVGYVFPIWSHLWYTVIPHFQPSILVYSVTLYLISWACTIWGHMRYWRYV